MATIFLEVFMATSKPRISFFSRPTDEAVAQFDRRARARKFAKRPSRRSKLLPYLESICLCIHQGRSFQGTANFLQEFHAIKVDRGTVRRFVLKNPLLLQGD
jgi:hypothetical protein